jgi:predicted outer membrane repeat protein
MWTNRAAWVPALGSVLLMAGTAPSRAAVFVGKVGDDAACGFRTSVLPNALQAAIEAVPTTVPGGDLYVIRVARTGSYVGTRVLIENRSLRVEGGFASCTSTSTDATNTTIDATGSAGGPVRVRGTTQREEVTLANLTLRGGTGVSGHGVSVRNANVTLDRVSLTANSALRGGGVDVEGDGLGARVTLVGATRVFSNTVTQEGGGINCARGAELEIESTAAVSSNDAFQGGGIYLNGCSGYANSGAFGIGGLFVNIGFNSAEQGAGLFARSSLGPTVFRIGFDLGPDDPAPLLISNEADVGGGAIFATGADTAITVADTLIDNNSAGSVGGGIVANSEALVVVTRERRVCPRGDRCSSISNNSANSGGGALAQGGGVVVIRGTYVEGNSAAAGSAVTVQGTNGLVELRNSVVAVNQDGASVLQVRDPSAAGAARLLIDQTTVTRNLDAARVIDVNALGTVRVSHSIVNEIAAMPVFDLPAGYTPETECSMFHEIASAGAVDPLTVAFPTPGFVDAAGGNFRLRPTAEATDRCPAGAASDPDDFEGDVRPLDGPLGDLAGRYDVGFDEYNELFFAEGFETP